MLRDRGYLTVGEMQRHLEAGASFIYRHKTGTSIVMGKVMNRWICPSCLLRRHGSLDQVVTLNDAARTRVRLVAAPVSQQTAALRRMKAEEGDQGTQPFSNRAGADGMDDLSDQPGAGSQLQRTAGDLYGLRWRIEVIFKAWKSQMDFDVIHRVVRPGTEDLPHGEAGEHHRWHGPSLPAVLPADARGHRTGLEFAEVYPLHGKYALTTG